MEEGFQTGAAIKSSRNASHENRLTYTYPIGTWNHGKKPAYIHLDLVNYIYIYVETRDLDPLTNSRDFGMIWITWTWRHEMNRLSIHLLIRDLEMDYIYSRDFGTRTWTLELSSWPPLKTIFLTVSFLLWAGFQTGQRLLSWGGNTWRKNAATSLAMHLDTKDLAVLWSLLETALLHWVNLVRASRELKREKWCSRTSLNRLVNTREEVTMFCDDLKKGITMHATERVDAIYPQLSPSTSNRP